MSSKDESIAKLEVYLGKPFINLRDAIRTKFYLLFTFFNPFALTDQAINNATSDDELDISALDAFCHMIKKEPDLSATAARLLAGRIQSQVVREALLSLDALEGNQLILIGDVPSV